MADKVKITDKVKIVNHLGEDVRIVWGEDFDGTTVIEFFPKEELEDLCTKTKET